MQHSDDIAHLFQEFASESDPYQELSRSEEQRASRARWPLVSALNSAGAPDIAPVSRGAAALSPPPPPIAWVAAAPVPAPATSTTTPTPAPRPAWAPAPVVAMPAPVPTPAPAPAPAMQTFAPVPAPLFAPAPVVAPSLFAPAPALTAAPPERAGHPFSAPSLDPRSPLSAFSSSALSHRGHAAAEPPAVPVTNDLPAIFARLAQGGASAPAAPAAGWFSRKGPQ